MTWSYKDVNGNMVQWISGSVDVCVSLCVFNDCFEKNLNLYNNCKNGTINPHIPLI